MMLRVSFLLALLCTTFAIATPAFASFAAKESKENSVTYEAKETPVAFLLEEKKEVKNEITCETIKAEGAVDEKAGFNGALKYDAPASVPTAESEQIGSKVKLEKCSIVILGIKASVTASTEKCQFEVYDALVTGNEAEAFLSIRGTEQEKPCTMTLEVAGICKVEVKSAGELENEELQKIRLVNVKEFEMKIEPSEVKGIEMRTSGCGLSEKAEGTLKFKKAILVKGADLVSPALIKEVEEVQQPGRVIQFAPTNAGMTSLVLPHWTSQFSNTVFGTITVQNTAGNAISKQADACSGKSYAINTGCAVLFKFEPPMAGGYEGIVTIPYSFTGRGGGGQLRERIEGTGL